jgi:hypothetical protein
MVETMTIPSIKIPVFKEMILKISNIENIDARSIKNTKIMPRYW